jgi:hypothetical protein
MSGKTRLALFFVLSLALAGVFTLLLGLRSGTVLLRDCQGDYCLQVREGSVDYLVLAPRRRHEIWLTRRAASDYGYALDHSFAPTALDLEPTIRACKVEWSDAGVTLVEPSGQRVFVPRRVYEGGR